MNIRGLARKAVIECVSPFSKPKNGIYILNGHYVNRFSSSDLILFRKQLKTLRQDYEFINIEVASKLIQEESESIGSHRAIAFSFDDGFSDCYDSIAPELDKYNVNAAFFVNPNFVDGDEDYCLDFISNKVMTPDKKPMTWSQIKILSESGFVIGNHTLDHKRLSHLDEEEFLKQVKESKLTIEKIISKDCDFFAWPYGQQSDIKDHQIKKLEEIHKYIFSGSDYTKYKSRQGAVINRRHFEPFWPSRHLKFFLSHGKTW